MRRVHFLCLALLLLFAGHSWSYGLAQPTSNTSTQGQYCTIVNTSKMGSPGCFTAGTSQESAFAAAQAFWDAKTPELCAGRRCIAYYPSYGYAPSATYRNPGGYTVYNCPAGGDPWNNICWTVGNFALFQGVVTDTTCPGGSFKNAQGLCQCQNGYAGDGTTCKAYTCPSSDFAAVGSTLASVSYASGGFFPTNVNFCAGGCGQAISPSNSTFSAKCTGTKCLAPATLSGPVGYCDTSSTITTYAALNTNAPAASGLTGISSVKASGKIPSAPAGNCVGTLTNTSGVDSTYTYPCATSTTVSSPTTSNVGGITTTSTLTDTTSCNFYGTCTTTTTTQISAGASTSSVSSTSSTLGANDPTQNDVCLTNPNKASCITTDGNVSASDSLSNTQKAMTFAEVAFSSVNVSSCPGGFSFTVAGQSYQVSSAPICDAMSWLRPIILAIAGVISAGILAAAFTI